jgi:hypothetical protein
VEAPKAESNRASVPPRTGSTFSLLRRGYRPTYASFGGEGPHALEIRTMDGKCVLQASGTGPKAYSLSGLAPKTVYEVSGRTREGEFSRRLLVP